MDYFDFATTMISLVAIIATGAWVCSVIYECTKEIIQAIKDKEGK